MIMLTSLRSIVHGPQHLLSTVDYRLSTERHGISDTTGFTPFVVVVGSNNFLPVSVCLLTRSESCKSSLDFLLR